MKNTTARFRSIEGFGLRYEACVLELISGEWFIELVYLVEALVWGAFYLEYIVLLYWR